MEKVFNTIKWGLAGSFKTALTRALNTYIQGSDLPKKLKQKVSGDDVREGLTAVVSVKIPSPQFEGQTKTKLGNSEVAGLASDTLNSSSACKCFIYELSKSLLSYMREVAAGCKYIYKSVSSASRTIS